MNYSDFMAWEKEKFEPHWLLKNGHAMTIAAAFARRRFELPSAEDRLFQVDPESRIVGRCHWQAGKRRDVPVIVILHGLEGSSESNYVRGIAEKALRFGFHAVRLNQRNCGGTEALTPTLYNSGMSGDYRAVLDELADRDGFEQIFFVGYSMGGNLVTKMAGEYGDAAPQALRAVCVVCPGDGSWGLRRRAGAPRKLFLPAAFCEGLDVALRKEGEALSRAVPDGWTRAGSFG